MINLGTDQCSTIGSIQRTCKRTSGRRDTATQQLPLPCCACRYREQRDITQPESLNLFLETRFEQLKTACELQMWAEAFRSVEDIQNLIALGKRQPKQQMMATYYRCGRQRTLKGCRRQVTCTATVRTSSACTENCCICLFLAVQSALASVIHHASSEATSVGQFAADLAAATQLRQLAQHMCAHSHHDAHVCTVA